MPIFSMFDQYDPYFLSCANVPLKRESSFGLTSKAIDFNKNTNMFASSIETPCLFKKITKSFECFDKSAWFDPPHA